MSDDCSIMRPTSVARIKQWLDHGKAVGATHVVVKVDTFALEAYPIYVMPDKSARAIAEHKGDEFTETIEVYNLALDLDRQLEEDRAYNI